MAKHQIHNVGILGGSFDPAHRGHLAISRIAIKKLKLKKVYWIVTKRNPFKKKSFFSIKKRIAKAKKIAKSIQKIQVLYIDEIINSSRSIDTIRYIFKCLFYNRFRYFIRFTQMERLEKISKINKINCFFS